MKKAFKFYRSYFEVAEELPPKERELFLMAILKKHFLDEEPQLKGMAKFAYISQRHSIEAQCDGYKQKVKAMTPPSQPPSQPPSEQTNKPIRNNLKRNNPIRNKPVSKEVRAQQFKKQVFEAISDSIDLPKDEILNFINHWTESNPNGRKLKFEMQQTFDIKKRLATWEKNYTKWNKPNPKEKANQEGKISKLRGYTNL